MARIPHNLTADYNNAAVLKTCNAASYIARSIGIGKPELEVAFAECRNKYECVCIYTDPPPGRSTFIINMSRPFDPMTAADGQDYCG